MQQIVLVCGGRNYSNADRLFRILDVTHAANPIVLLVHGAARGADSLAGRWAADRCVPVKAFPADWDTHGNSAGPIRNQQMLAEAKPHLVIAFPGGKGTADMISKATSAGVPVVTVRPSHE